MTMNEKELNDVSSTDTQPAARAPGGLELNKGDQFIVALDISASMGQTDTPTKASRIDYCLETVRGFCGEAAKWDFDGVSFYLFGAKCHAFPDLKPEATPVVRSTIGARRCAACLTAAPSIRSS